MIRKNIFGGCNNKNKSSCIFNDKVYYCSSSNILISDDIEIKDVIFLDNNLNFLKVHTENFLLSGDILGNLYIIEKNTTMKNQHWLIDKIKFTESLQEAIFIDENIILCIFLKKIILYNYANKNEVLLFDLNLIITASLFVQDFILIGTAEGDVIIYDKNMKLINKHKAHEDRIQDINYKIIDNKCFIATSSKDATIKVWELFSNNLLFLQTLVGHSDWVNQVNWTIDDYIISASFDKTIMVWKLTESNIWECESILGGVKPFINAFKFKDYIIGQSSTGSFYKFNECISDFLSGHTNEISSLDWNDKYLLTTSLDKTARIFYKNREVGRPITHGYEISAGRFINKKSLSVIIGAYETIIRVLDPTYIFYMSCEWMKKNHVEDSTFDFFKNLNDLKIAAVPAELSLTNDALEDYEFENVNEYLLSTTSFMEVKKIYGHYFEISDIAVSENFIASCNKSLSKKFGGIFLWNKNYENIAYLEVHSYGIIKIKISPDEKYLCSVSKDKTSCIYEIREGLNLKYRNFDHKRIIWDCAFSFDSRFYATCSRDRKIFVYDLHKDNKCISVHEFDSEVTALDFSPVNYLLVVGTEKGNLYQIVYENEQFILQKDYLCAHSQRINCIKINHTGDVMATGGKDGLINIFEL